MTFATRMKALADRMLDTSKFGKVLATFTRDLNTGIDPVTLQEAESNTTTYQALVAPVNITQYAFIAKNLGLINSEFNISENEKFLYVQANGTKPQRGDTVSLDSLDWEIRDIEVFEVQNTDCAYLLKIGH